MTGEITFGEFTLSSVVAVLLGVVFEAAPTFPSQYKKLIAILLGITLAMLGIVVQAGAWTAANVVLHLVAGIMYGVAAIGTYHTINKTTAEKNPTDRSDRTDRTTESG
jgi:TctA family transporter